MASLRNVEEDEAGRLRAFRMRFGRGWDAEADPDSSESSTSDSAGAQEESLMDLISGFGGEGQGMESERGVGGEAEKGKGGDDVEMVTVRKDGVLVKVPALSKGERRGKS
jgi:hypothetical protein